MEQSNIKLFSMNDNEEMVMPDINKGNNVKYDNSEDVNNALFGEKVKTILIKDEQIIELPNIVFDFSKNMSMNIFQKLALDGIITENGDTAVYLYSTGNLMKIGTALSSKIESIINVFKTDVLNSDVLIYKDVQEGKPLTEINKKDITKLRMNI